MEKSRLMVHVNVTYRLFIMIISVEQVFKNFFYKIDYNKDSLIINICKLRIYLTKLSKYVHKIYIYVYTYKKIIICIKIKY